MLDVGGNDVFAFFGIGKRDAFDGMIYGFSAAGGEYDFFGRSSPAI